MIVRLMLSMIESYLKIGWRTLLRNKGYSLINIGGLAVGMAVAMLIGLWIYDEVSINRNHAHYQHIAQVKQHTTLNGERVTGEAVPVPLARELRNSFGGDLKLLVLSSWTEGHVLSVDDVKFWKTGNFMEPDAPEMLSLEILEGTLNGLSDANSVMLSESSAKAFFPNESALNKVIIVDGDIPVKVTAVYRDLPRNSAFGDLNFILPWQLNVNLRDWVKNSETNWTNNSFRLFVQIADHASMQDVSKKISKAKLASGSSEIALTDPVVFLHPMSEWHLYSEFKNGINTGGRIHFVWLFGIISIFVLLLACINFMNLSTARSEKRAKEVGIRKAIGSIHRQLISQFFSESLLVALLALVIAIALVGIVLPSFNDIADKNLTIPWANVTFWILCIAFCSITGIVAGSYPALYLSSVQPIRALKGTFRASRSAHLPRKVLVVVQFTVSITLIIGTVVIHRQIQYAKERPVGYNRESLVFVQTTTPEIHNHFDALRNDLLSSGTAVEVAESESPLTGIWNFNGGFTWSGKSPDMQGDFAVIGVTPEFGKTVGWKILMGRDFAAGNLADSTAMVINEAAVKFMGLENPVGEVIMEPDGNGGVLKYTIIGVIKDMIMTSPYEPVRQTLFYVGKGPTNFINIRLNPETETDQAISSAASIFRKHAPTSFFDYKFAEEEYAKKFATEARVGRLATIFSALAIFISLLGLFGLASFVAEQRTKEIGIRKVLGASVAGLWRMLSKDFLILVIISCVIAAPIAWGFTTQWLQKFDYHTDFSIWILIITSVGALALTLLIVSFQVIKAATLSPVKSLKSE